ncbi:MAG TPA: hypothetical protein VMU89_16430 [Thermomicrobiaceae bacterium]|nr:hypothetical protein [Thermomicrobiaceae bacterium]
MNTTTSSLVAVERSADAAEPAGDACQARKTFVVAGVTLPMTSSPSSSEC